MRKQAVLIVLTVAALLLTSCSGGYMATGGSTQSHQSGNSGWIEVHQKTATGTMTKDIGGDVEGLEGALWSGAVLAVDVTLACGTGTYKIELLGENDAVTLTLEAQAGQTVSGSGQIVVDGFGDANYRVTATEAGNVDYRLDYTIQ